MVHSPAILLHAWRLVSSASHAQQSADPGPTLRHLRLIFSHRYECVMLRHVCVVTGRKATPSNATCCAS